MQKISLVALLAIFVAVTCGCGSSGSSLQGTYSVKDVNILANDINIGESVRVEVFFETKTEVDGTPDGLDVIVRIPAELDFVPGSSGIYDNSTDDSDSYTPQEVVRCETGEIFLVYQFNDFDLFEREIGTAGSFGLKFEARGRSTVSSTFVGATAGSSETFRCGEFYAAEENEAVQVL